MNWSFFTGRANEQIIAAVIECNASAFGKIFKDGHIGTAQSKAIVGQGVLNGTSYFARKIHRYNLQHRLYMFCS